MYYLGFLGGSVVKNSPAMQEMQVRSLGQEDPLEKDMATHSSILAWEIDGQRNLAGYSSQGRKRARRDLASDKVISHAEVEDSLWKTDRLPHLKEQRETYKSQEAVMKIVSDGW